MTLQISPLLDYVSELTPRYVAPRHLAPLAARLERARVEPLRLVVSVPPRHGKTELLIHFIAWTLAQDASAQIVYASYAGRLSEKKSRKARDLARIAGVPIAEDASSRADWRTNVGEGGCWATGVEGALTGEGADITIVDDPHKDRASAESALQRQAVFEWYTDVLSTRGEPGASHIVCLARWHQDDLGGRLIAMGWEHISLPAIGSDGAALWPERFDLAALAKLRQTVGEYTWASLFMGQPYARGGAVFKDAYYFDELPTGHVQLSIGCDFAYSTKARADWSVAVVLAEQDGTYYVLDVVRLQVVAPDFLSQLKTLQAAHGNVRASAYIAGQERGVLDTMQAMGGGLNIDARPATQDKFTRAQPVSAAWCAGKIRLPRAAPWLNSFVSEIVSFTGQGDVHDDQVDALAAAFDAVAEDSSMPEWATPEFVRGARAFLGGYDRIEPPFTCTPDYIRASMVVRGNPPDFTNMIAQYAVRTHTPPFFSPNSSAAFKTAVNTYRLNPR